ncbi:hypothetical protein HII13_002225 [Brettanomyces bruxellensis]|nr:hypothetical protein HII13_002225 [Brettanomyces bruxellensis]
MEEKKSSSTDTKSLDMSPEDHVLVNEALPAVNLKKMVRKVDFIVLPIMMITYCMQFMDKLALSSGSVFGVKTDLHLVGQDYSWCSSIFYFGFMLGNFIAARILHIVPLGKLIFTAVFFWGITLACSAASQNYAGLMVARFVLGFCESFVSPTFVFMTTMWWTQQQGAFRTNIYFAGNDIGGVISSLIAFGIGHAGGALMPWRYLFICYGCLAFVWSFVILFFLPDTPSKARFFDSSEKKYYKEEMSTSEVEKKWDWEQAKSCVTDVNVWLILVAIASSILPNSGVISYGYIILDSFGFTSIQSTLINLALSVFTWFCITFAGYLASHFKNSRCYVILIVVVFSLVGGCLIYKGQAKGVKLLGYFLVDVQPAITPLLLGMTASNFKGNTRRSVVNSAVFIVYCACNIAGPQLFRAKDAPHYPHAFLSWIVCYCISACLAVIMRFSWIHSNKKLERLAESAVLPATKSTDSEKEEIMEFMDPTFRYKY